MVLDDVADCAGLVVESPAALHTKVFRHSDLHALDVVAVPERLHESVREAEDDHVIHWPLAKVVVYAEDGRFREGGEQDPVKLLRRGEVMAEWLLDDDPCALGAAGFHELFDHFL